MGFGAALTQALAFGAVTDQDQARARFVLAHGLEGRHHRTQVFFGRQPADAQGDAGARVGAPTGAQGRAAVQWAEALRVDTARHHAQPLQARGGELVLQALGGHHGAGRAVVEVAQIGHHRGLQPGHAVVPAVGVEVGAEVTDHRQAQSPRSAQRRPAQRAFGDDVHDIRPLRRPQALQQALRRQAHLQFGVARYRQATHQHLVEAGFTACQLRVTLARPHQLQVVATRLQAFDHACKRHRHAIHFGWIGFGHQCHAQGARHRQGRFQQGVSPCGKAVCCMVPSPRNSSMTSAGHHTSDTDASCGVHAERSQWRHANHPGDPDEDFW